MTVTAITCRRETRKKQVQIMKRIFFHKNPDENPSVIAAYGLAVFLVLFAVAFLFSVLKDDYTFQCEGTAIGELNIGSGGEYHEPQFNHLRVNGLAVECSGSYRGWRGMRE